MKLIQKAKGFLFDLDGVFIQSGKTLPGAKETLKSLRDLNIPFRFLTNTTTKNRRTLQASLADIGLQCSEEEFKENRDAPKVIVIGDYDDWTFDLLDQAFKHVMNGAEIIALHMGKYYKVDTGLRLDAGSFVAALEFSTGKKAQIVGKPNKEFFQCALDHLRLRSEDVVMLGDDLINDVKGAQDIGIPGILVKTGKYHKGMVESSGINPDGFLHSIADLPNILNS